MLVLINTIYINFWHFIWYENLFYTLEKKLASIQYICLEHQKATSDLPGMTVFSQVTSQVVLAERNLPASARDASSIPGSGRSPGEGNGNPF